MPQYPAILPREPVQELHSSPPLRPRRKHRQTRPLPPTQSHAGSLTNLPTPAAILQQSTRVAADSFLRALAADEPRLRLSVLSRATHWTFSDIPMWIIAKRPPHHSDIQLGRQVTLAQRADHAATFQGTLTHIRAIEQNWVTFYGEYFNDYEGAFELACPIAWATLPPARELEHDVLFHTLPHVLDDLYHVNANTGVVTRKGV